MSEQAVSSPTGAEQTIEQLDRSLIQGVAWTGGVKWLVQVFSWAGTLVVVRLISPEDYGVVGSAALLLGLLGLLADFGIGAAVITMRDLSTERLRQLNGAAMLFGALTALLCIAAAWPIGAFFRSTDVTMVVMAMSATLVIAGFRSVPASLLQRSMRFRTLALIEAGQALAGMLATVALALAGWGYWALVGGAVVQSALYTTLVLRSQPFPASWPDRRALKEPLRLSLHVITGQLSWWTYSNADFAIAGRVLGQATLGTYLLAWEFASLPVEKITNIVTRVTPAVFSALQNDPPALRVKLLLLTEGIATLTLPASLGLALVADDFVALAFGSQWTAAVAPLQLLCLYISLRSVVTMLPQLLIATGDSRLTARMGIVFVLVMPASFLVGSHWGTVGIASAWLIVFPFLNIPYYRRVFLRLELTFGQYLGCMRRPIIGSIIMSAVLLFATEPLDANLPLAARLPLKVLLGAVIYGGMVVWPQRERIASIFRSLRA